MLMHPRRRAQPASPGRARHPDKRALCVGAVTEATRKLTLNGGADGSSVKVGRSTLTTEHRQKFIWTRRNVNMEKNDIFNTNLLQLPLKAQVADEGVVQDIAPVAAPADLAGGVAELELDALNQRGVVLQRLSDVTPKKCEKLASGFLHRGEITLLCGDGGVGKGQFVAQIAKSLTTGEPTEFFPQASEGTGNIVILAGEDPIDTVLCPRMDAAGADLNKVAVIAPDTYYEEMHKMPQLGNPDLMNWIAAGDPLLLVIDPFRAFLPDSVNLNNRQQIRGLLQLLRMQAQQHGFAILLVTHSDNPEAIQKKIDKSKILEHNVVTGYHINPLGLQQVEHDIEMLDDIMSSTNYPESFMKYAMFNLHQPIKAYRFKDLEDWLYAHLNQPMDSEEMTEKIMSFGYIERYQGREPGQMGLNKFLPCYGVKIVSDRENKRNENRNKTFWTLMKQ